MPPLFSRVPGFWGSLKACIQALIRCRPARRSEAVCALLPEAEHNAQAHDQKPVSLNPSKEP